MQGECSPRPQVGYACPERQTSFHIPFSLPHPFLPNLGVQLVGGHVSRCSYCSCSPSTECLTSFTDLETLGETEWYYCTCCKSRQPSTKQLSLHTLPNVSDLSLEWGCFCVHVSMCVWMCVCVCVCVCVCACNWCVCVYMFVFEGRTFWFTKMLFMNPGQLSLC